MSWILNLCDNLIAAPWSFWAWPQYQLMTHTHTGFSPERAIKPCLRPCFYPLNMGWQSHQMLAQNFVRANKGPFRLQAASLSSLMTNQKEQHSKWRRAHWRHWWSSVGIKVASWFRVSKQTHLRGEAGPHFDDSMLFFDNFMRLVSCPSATATTLKRETTTTGTVITDCLDQRTSKLVSGEAVFKLCYQHFLLNNNEHRRVALVYSQLRGGQAKEAGKMRGSK